MSDDDEDGEGNGSARDADEGNAPAGDDGDRAGAASGEFGAELERARELLAQEEVDGVYAAVVSDDKYEYAFGHRGGDPEVVGMQAMGLLAQHVGAMVEQTGQPPAQVAGDAAMLARTLGITGEESLADIEADIEGGTDAVPGGGTDDSAADDERGADSSDDGASDEN